MAHTRRSVGHHPIARGDASRRVLACSRVFSTQTRDVPDTPFSSSLDYRSSLSRRLFSRLFPHAVIVPFLFLPAARLANLRNAARAYDAIVAVAAAPNAGATFGPAAHNAAVSGFSNAPNGDDVPRFAFAALVAKSPGASIASPNPNASRTGSAASPRNPKSTRSPGRTHMERYHNAYATATMSVIARAARYNSPPPALVASPRLCARVSGAAT